MPTYRHRDTGKRFLFIHIPRTGGRFIESNLELNGWEIEPIEVYGVPHGNWSVIDDCELAHFHKDLYEKHCENIENIPHVCIVRNPIDKFLSASIYLKRMYGNDIQEIVEDEMMFFSMLDNFPFPEAVNWFRCQVDFLTDKTHVWKFENRLGSSFGNWMSEILEVPFEVDSFATYHINSDEGINKLDRSARLLDNIRKLYRRDIEQLYPELAAPFQEGAEAETETASTPTSKSKTEPL